MPVYFKIKDHENSPALYAPVDEAKQILDSMAENCLLQEVNEKYTFEAVEMTEAEFNNLPEFAGF